MGPLVEENESNVEDEELPEEVGEKKPVEEVVNKEADKVAPEESLVKLCTETDVVESAFTAIKEEENSLVAALKENQTNDSAEKENLPIVKVLDTVIVSKQIPRQKPKSGKFWKEGRQQFRQIKKDKGRKFTFEQRMKNKEEMRKKIDENKARKLENEKK